jgi:hypothetical protein
MVGLFMIEAVGMPAPFVEQMRQGPFCQTPAFGATRKRIGDSGRCLPRTTREHVVRALTLAIADQSRPDAGGGSDSS